MKTSRRQHLFAPKWWIQVAAALVGGCPWACGAAYGDDGWSPPALFPQPRPDARISFAGTISSGFSRGLVPPFRVGARDRFTGGLDAVVWLPHVELAASWAWL